MVDIKTEPNCSLNWGGEPNCSLIFLCVFSCIVTV